jgi:hypothetical protein
MSERRVVVTLPVVHRRRSVAGDWSRPYLPGMVLPSGFIAPCQPSKVDRPPSGPLAALPRAAAGLFHFATFTLKAAKALGLVQSADKRLTQHLVRSG